MVISGSEKRRWQRPKFRPHNSPQTNRWRGIKSAAALLDFNLPKFSHTPITPPHPALAHSCSSNPNQDSDPCCECLMSIQDQTVHRRPSTTCCYFQRVWLFHPAAPSLWKGSTYLLHNEITTTVLASQWWNDLIGIRTAETLHIFHCRLQMNLFSTLVHGKKNNFFLSLFVSKCSNPSCWCSCGFFWVVSAWLNALHCKALVHCK